MKFNLRKTSKYADCSIEHSGTTIDFGPLDSDEIKSLLAEFKSAVEEMEWFFFDDEATK